MHFLLVCFLLLAGIQVIFLSLYLFAFLKKRVTPESPEVPVSVIVCAQDEEQNLRELVPLLLEQDYPSYEVIVVEDRSNDDSYEFLYNYAHPRLRVVRVTDKPEHITGKKFALTLGVKAAVNEWILLTDADCRPNNNQWIREMSGCFNADTQIVLGYSPYKKMKGLLNSLIRFETLLTAIQYIGLALMGKPYMGVGRNLAYRKSLFLSNKGFNKHLSVTGGDDDLFVNKVANKSNTAVCMGEASMMRSEPKKTWSEYFLQKIRHLSVGKYYKLSDKIILGLFNISWIGFWILLISLLVGNMSTYVVLTALFVRAVLLMILYRVASRKLGDLFEVWKVVFLDFILAIYYLVTGLIALQTNKIRWKKT